MNKYIKDVLIFLAGTGVGGGIAYAFAKKKYSELCDQEIKTMRDTFNDMQQEIIAKNESEKKRVLNEQLEKITSYHTETNVDEITEDQVGSEIIDENMDSDIQDEEPIAVRQSSFSKDDPEIISEDEYGNYEDEMGEPFEPMTLFYHQDDGELYEEDRETVVDDPIALIGEENFGKLPELFEQEDVVYARNFMKHCDYEILLELPD